MQVLRFIRNHPVTIACVVLVGLNLWVGIQLFEVGTRSIEPRAAHVPHDAQVVSRKPVSSRMLMADVMPLDRDIDSTKPKSPAPCNLVVSTAALPKLKPGMTRAEVEGLLGPPPANQIHAVTVNNDRITYRTTYELSESELPMTIRPIQSRTRVPSQPTAPLTTIALEFDASLPGHPLIGVLYPDPLF